MELSVIIPCRNGAETIAAQLDALAKQECPYPWEIIVSDNGSTDETLQIVEKYKNRLPNLRVVDSSDIRGGSHARNVGAHVATGKALAFCDADDEVAPGWVKAITEGLREHDFVASRFETEKLNTSEIQNYVGRHSQQDGLQVLWYPPYLQHSGGCGLGIKRSIHEAVGGFDESLPRLMDTDYCLKIQLAGHELHFVTNAVIQVRYRNDLGQVFCQARLWAKYNTLMYKKYRPPDVRISKPWKKYVKDWLRLLRSLPQLNEKTHRARWTFLLGWQIGLLQGSTKYRVMPAVFPREPIEPIGSHLVT